MGRLNYHHRCSNIGRQQTKSCSVARQATVSQHYLGGEPIIQSTHNFLRKLKQEPGMSIQAWHTLVRLEYQKCNFPPEVDDRLQRDIFVIGLNDSFRRFHSDIISHEDLTSLTFAQVIPKARDFEASIQTDSAITQQHLEEAANKVSPTEDRPTGPSRPPRRPIPPVLGQTNSKTCIWRGRAPHTTRRACPASNDTCHACGKRGHWQQVCRASSVKVVSDVEQDTHIDPHQPSYFITHDVCQVSSAPKGIFVDLDLSSSASSSVKHLKFQVDSGCSCNTMHVTDLNKLPPVPVKPSSIFL